VPIMGFPQIYHASTYQYRAESGRSDFNQIDLHIVVGLQICSIQGGMVFNATFNNISVLLMEETRVP